VASHVHSCPFVPDRDDRPWKPVPGQAASFTATVSAILASLRAFAHHASGVNLSRTTSALTGPSVSPQIFLDHFPQKGDRILRSGEDWSWTPSIQAVAGEFGPNYPVVSAVSTKFHVWIRS